jgi:hypothetical protein
MSNSNGYGHTRVDKRDFDANRPLLAADHDREDGQGRRRSGSGPSGLSANGADDGHSDGLLSEVVDNIVERDRQKMKREVLRISSFVWGVISWFVVLLPVPF